MPLMRWLLVKDLQILRRSPLLVGLLIVYPVAVALMIGFALSSPPGKPKVAYYSQIAPGHGKVRFGSQTINVSHYASALFKSIQPIRVHSRAQAIANGPQRPGAGRADRPRRTSPRRLRAWSPRAWAARRCS